MITGRLHYIAVLVMVIEEIPTIDAQNLISLDWIKMQENWMSPNISLIRVQKLRRNPKTKGLHYTSHPKMVIGLIDIEYKKKCTNQLIKLVWIETQDTWMWLNTFWNRKRISKLEIKKKGLHYISLLVGVITNIHISLKK